MAKFYGYNPPFFGGNTLFGVSSNVMPRQEDYRLIRNDYLQGLLTIHGERPFRPTFGGNIPSFLFEPNDIVSRNNIEEAIRTYTEKFEPRIFITKIDVAQDQNNQNVANVKIFGRFGLDASNSEQMIVNFLIPVAGAANG